jgi:hypothetical protein
MDFYRREDLSGYLAWNDQVGGVRAIYRVFVEKLRKETTRRPGRRWIILSSVIE